MLPGICGICGAGSVASGSGGGGSGLVTDSYFGNSVAPATATASFQVSGGTVTASNPATSYNWQNGVIGTDYEIRATVSSGSFSTGTTGAWLSLGSARTWSVSRSTSGSKICIALFEIRPAGGGANVTSATITLDVEVA